MTDAMNVRGNFKCKYGVYGPKRMLVTVERVSPTQAKMFCSICGSTLYIVHDNSYEIDKTLNLYALTNHGDEM